MIRKLPAELILAIAAGEVVGAPVDVVRELIDNALDAQATRLAIKLEDGGLTRISVVDNGVGIAKDDLYVAVQPHTTSKLESLTNIHTLGFRGEGLFAIAHAGKLRITSRPKSQLGGATLSFSEPFTPNSFMVENLSSENYEDAEVYNLTEHPAPAVTEVQLADIFSHLPARRSALESPAQETRKILQLVHRYLLHYPNLQMVWEADGQNWSFAGGGFFEACKFVWGSVTANRLLAIPQSSLLQSSMSHSEEEMHITGLVSRPELSRPRADRLHLAINGRPVHWHDSLLKAVLAAYQDMLPSGNYPVGILNVVLPPEQVVPNISPDKRHVKLHQLETIAQELQTVLANLLAQHPLAPDLPTLHEPFLEAINSTGISPAARDHSFPNLQPIGTFRQLYILAEADDQLWIVDQHAAHERILYEHLQYRYQNEPPVDLPYPELLQLSRADIATYQARSKTLAEYGLKLEPFGRPEGGTETWRILRVPSLLLGHPQLIAEVVKESLQHETPEKAWRKVLGRLACLPAIKAGAKLSLHDAVGLLDQLSACAIPWSCPHGRPTALVVDELTLARRFGRRSTRALMPRVAKNEES